ncbi:MULTISPECIES: hypothetical protein [unclassified Clostridium]|uniref:hypothetical protein n=1 Tax=unclassified Clostridium TaxID=2614128 RepID=UPI0002976744|nr:MULTISPECIES: hypothetical protein [unclassified Clostridium]EKQ56409.1 MAG: hypothetical protein A370_02001 [Clostridium sp. Maddingley MBC34-26]
MRVVSKSIEVVAYFDTDGRIKPIKFRIEENDGYKVIKISKIISTDLENKMLVFRCSSVIGEKEIIFELKYDPENCTWILYKI